MHLHRSIVGARLHTAMSSLISDQGSSAQFPSTFAMAKPLNTMVQLNLFYNELAKFKKMKMKCSHLVLKLNSNAFQKRLTSEARGEPVFLAFGN